MFSIVPFEQHSSEVKSNSWSGPHAGMEDAALPVAAHGRGVLPAKTILEDVPLLPPALCRSHGPHPVV